MPTEVHISMESRSLLLFMSISYSMILQDVIVLVSRSFSFKDIAMLNKLSIAFWELHYKRFQNSCHLDMFLNKVVASYNMLYSDAIRMY